MAQKADVLVTNVALFDGEAFKDETYDVRVEDGRFSAVEPAGTLEKQDSETVVDGTGHTLTPGIIDCHIHALVNNAGSLEGFTEPFSLQFYRGVENLRLTLEAGVTSARDAGGADAGVREALERGLVRGPRLKVAVTIMSQTAGHGDGMLPSGACSPMLMPHPGRPSGVADGAQGVQVKTRELIRAGADHIKICSTGGVLSAADDPRHSQFTVDEISTIVAEATAQGRRVMSHAQGTAGIKNAVLAGVASIEHGIYLDDETVDLMLERDCVLVPTLQAPLAVIRAAEAGVPIPEAMVEKARRVAERHRESVAMAHQAGVRIAMGTDAGVGVHGQNLEELELMAGVGMSTAEVLRASTANAADLMGDDSVGRVRVGNHGDFVLFEGSVEEHGVGQLRSVEKRVFQGGVAV
ncbi:amidohydrolase family protein [Brevibacterium mcbrellneri ATCC 49030]|uniref:Amidohydrolase family protein n=1 Tax=Brevibacterium mcbrellneri ATCC 49030 TaxID=585530 RepID=D4YQB7_9MICO|nr:amidohydrolase family protein [Brevibacterium mcbrellneri]EFG46574.1 amidohydrolase family protein [Brevibacterium mcbrellneri ATCC 49030]